jgi:hypothetical protein
MLAIDTDESREIPALEKRIADFGSQVESLAMDLFPDPSGVTRRGLGRYRRPGTIARGEGGHSV